MPKPLVRAQLTMTPEEHQALTQAAKDAGMSVNAYVMGLIQRMQAIGALEDLKDAIQKS